MTRVVVLILLVAWGSGATLAGLYWWGEALSERRHNRELVDEINRARANHAAAMRRILRGERDVAGD